MNILVELLGIGLIWWGVLYNRSGESEIKSLSKEFWIMSILIGTGLFLIKLIH